MLSHRLILCHPLLCLPSIFPSIRVFSSESALHIRFPKYWSFNFSISPSSEYSRLISLRIDWFDLFAVQGTLRCLLQHHSLKASILWCSAFFMVQLSHLYMTTEKKKWRWQYVLLSAKWCLCFLMLSRFVTWIKVVAFIKSVFKTMVSRAHSIIRHQFSSVAQSCPTLCDPTNRITPGLPVHHQLPEFTQTHAHWVGDAIQPSHPLSSPSPPAPKLS